jgi:multiple antibiotic resistance protein
MTPTTAAPVIGPAEIFTLFFVTLGPLKIFGPFAQRTHDLDDVAARQVAVRAFVIATLAAVIGGFVGRSLAENWNVSIPAMMLTAGIIFFLVALQQLLEQYEPPHGAAPQPLPASPTAAALRLVFPIVLTPYGIAAVITLLAASRDAQRTEVIIGLLVTVMVLNLLAMLFARRVMSGATVVVLQLIGAVLAVLQVALAVQIIIGGLQRLGVVS